jgi:sirohydrochlorin cobaltochelatase
MSDSAFPAKPNSALLLVGHGSTQNPDSSAPTLVHAAELRRRGTFAEVASAFWKEEPGLREVYHQLESPEIYIVPNFISEGYFTKTVIPRELELTGATTLRNGRRLHYCAPVGSHPHMTEVLLHRARETAPEVDPKEITLFIVGHGTGLNDNSAKAAKDQVRWIEERGLYGEVIASYMEEPPLISDWATLSRCENVVVVPFFIADGLHSYEDIPVLLGIESETGKAASQQEVFRCNPYHLHGKTLYYASAIGTEPLMADLILDQIRDFDARQVFLNGAAYGLPEEITLPDFLSHQQLPLEALLVEHNGLALHRSEWSERVLQPGDRLEVLRVAAGG